MSMNTTRRTLAVCALSAAAVLGGCGSGLSGKFGSEKDGADFDFKSGGKVEITVLGSTRVGTYTLEDGKVYISAGNETHAFKFDDAGCIDGGFLFGKLCRK